MQHNNKFLKILEYVVLFIALLLVLEWETTKQAAKDAWEGVYNPPTEQAK